MPAVAVITDVFEELCKAQAKRCGVPELPLMVLPHPVGGEHSQNVEKKVEERINDLIDMLTRPGKKPVSEQQLSRTLEIEGDDLFRSVNKFFLKNQWGDGLPLVPPTEEMVEQMLAGTNLGPDHIVAMLEPKAGKATIEKIAINAVMAGCEPEYLPVVIAATKAIAEPAFNLKGIQSTTGAATPLIVVNGPIAKELNINSGTGCFGPGWQANATIGRALRLIMQNVGGALPAEIDKATFGQPGKYTFCIAENEADSPWDPLSMEMGFSGKMSTVTVMGIERSVRVSFFLAKSAKDIMKSIANGMKNQHPLWEGEMLCILNPEAAHMIASEGYTKEDIREFIYSATAMPFSKFKTYSAVAMNQFNLPKKWFDLHLDEDMIPMFRRSDDILIMVAGGPGKHIFLAMSWAPGTRIVTKEIER